MSPTEKLEEAFIEAVIEAERIPNHAEASIGRVVLERTELSQQEFERWCDMGTYLERE